jgi:cytochrome c-type biogenesis protein
MSVLYIATSFLAGFASFLSPCVLPIIPGFLVYLAGTTTGTVPKRKDVFIESIFFVLGFSLVFAILGVLLQTILHTVSVTVSTYLSYIGGAIIIFFGLYLLGLIKISYLDRNHAVQVNTNKERSRQLTAFLFGLAFAVGWTPCAGAVLGGILTLSLSAPASAFFLLLAYALGLGIPFLIVGYFSTEAAKLINRFGTKLAVVNTIFGILMILIGILVFTQNLALVANIGALNNIILK